MDNDNTGVTRSWLAAEVFMGLMAVLMLFFAITDGFWDRAFACLAAAFFVFAFCKFRQLLSRDLATYKQQHTADTSDPYSKKEG